MTWVCFQPCIFIHIFEKVLNFYASQFSHLLKKDNNSTYLTGITSRRIQDHPCQTLAQHLPYHKGSLNHNSGAYYIYPIHYYPSGPESRGQTQPGLGSLWAETGDDCYFEMYHCSFVGQQNSTFPRRH